MFPKVQNTTELLSLATTEELYVALIGQLNKDFELSNIEEVIPKSITSNDLNAQLFTIINELIQKDFDVLLSVLYRIDVPESKAVRNSNQTFEDYIELLVFSILKRELQKVWLRKNFS